jgi:hypothetical protein
MNWRVFAASAIGKHHLDVGIPCQDAFAFERAGEHLIAVVCDGAGSAAHSDQGATTVAREIVAGLAALVAAPDASTAVSVDAITAVVKAARDHLADMAAEQQIALRDLACTLVGVVVAPNGGWAFHIGDGLALAAIEAGEPLVSSPDNGEYANETYFLTAEDWAAHLRLLPLPGGVTSLALMSDGAMPFVMNRARNALFEPFIAPVTKYLADIGEEEGSTGLAATLGDERTWSITGDDKTLLLAFADLTGAEHELTPPAD